jgi:UDP-glucuronate 4-epimerase
MKHLVTGAAGFIGFHVVQHLLERGEEVVGLDNINPYYSLELKFARLAESGIAREKEDYLNSNFTGFLHLLECCRFYPLKHFVFASSSSVYGSNAKMPFSASDGVDHPISLYAASKKSNELMPHSYSHLLEFQRQDFAFSRFMALWTDLIGLIFFLLLRFAEGSTFKYLIRVK